MLKFLETMVTFTEVPDEISLCINITNCPCHCKNCSEPWLADNIGAELDWIRMNFLIKKNPHITCICFMGGDSDYQSIYDLTKEIKRSYPNLKVAIYSGRQEMNYLIEDIIDYYKVGPWIEELGGLNKKTSNQKLYKKENNEWVDITYRLWEKE